MERALSSERGGISLPLHLTADTNVAELCRNFHEERGEGADVTLTDIRDVLQVVEEKGDHNRSLNSKDGK